MRVALLGSGKSYHATRWANGLNENGAEVEFISIHALERPLNPGVRFHSVGNGRKINYVTAAAQVRSILRKVTPDIVHAHFSTGYGVLARLACPGPYIVSVYGTDIYEFPKRSYLHKCILSWVLSGAAQVLSTSEDMAARCIEIFPRLSKPAVTPFGVDVTLFAPNPIAKDVSLCRYGVVKKLEFQYGIDILIDAVGQMVLDGRKNQIRLTIVGDGSQRRKLESEVRTRGLSEVVDFVGSIPNDEVPDFLNKIDVFVIPSRSESFGVAAVEAQACGLPVIAARVGGLPEVVADGTTGLLFSKGDASQLASRMEFLLENPESRRRMGVAARKRVLEQYDWSMNISQMTDIYRRQCRPFAGVP